MNKKPTKRGIGICIECLKETSLNDMIIVESVSSDRLFQTYICEDCSKTTTRFKVIRPYKEKKKK